MLRFAMLSLICSVTAGVFGFGGGGSSSWLGGPILFLIFLAFSAVGFLAGLTAKPARLREARIDDRSSQERPTKDTHDT
jgi:uncharacterized membrane protein YtjA (UPF0391 family)